MTFSECPHVEISHHLSQAVKAFHFRFEKKRINCKANQFDTKRHKKPTNCPKPFSKNCSIICSNKILFQMEKMSSLLSPGQSPPIWAHQQCVKPQFCDVHVSNGQPPGTEPLRCLWMLDVNNFRINFKIANVEMKFIMIFLTVIFDGNLCEELENFVDVDILVSQQRLH